MVCDLTIAADNAIFGQTGPKVIFWPIFIDVYYANRDYRFYIVR